MVTGRMQWHRGQKRNCNVQVHVRRAALVLTRPLQHLLERVIITPAAPIWGHSLTAPRIRHTSNVQVGLIHGTVLDSLKYLVWRVKEVGINMSFIYIDSSSSNVIDFNTDISVDIGNTNAAIQGAEAASHSPEESAPHQRPSSRYVWIRDRPTSVKLV